MINHLRVLLSAAAPLLVFSTMKRRILRIIGIIMVILGVSVLSLFAYKKISRELYLRKLLKENIIFEIPSLNIKVPVLEGTDSKALQVSIIRTVTSLLPRIMSVIRDLIVRDLCTTLSPTSATRLRVSAGIILFLWIRHTGSVSMTSVQSPMMA